MAAVVKPLPQSEAGTPHPPATASVVVCAFDAGRWDDVVRSVEALGRQTRRPDQVVLVIDHNDDLLQRAADHFAVPGDGVPVDVIANTLQRGLSGSRNAGIAWCHGDVIAFLDDEACVGDAYWLATMMEDYVDPDVAGVGGGATADWDGADAPAWFPPEFGWVVGCGYRGLPTDADDVRTFVGCNMSFRREVFEEIGGFRDGDEAEYCGRLRHRFPAARLMFDPDLDVTRHISPDRRDFAYFRAQCRREGFLEAVVARRVGAQEGLVSDRAYATKVLPLGVLRGVGEGVRGRVGGFQRSGAIVIGALWSAAGYARGRVSRNASF